MSLITLLDGHLAYGDKPLLDGARFAMQVGERVGVIGRTGTGKPPVDPWGNLTKGYRTRNNKRTQTFIVSRRKK